MIHSKSLVLPCPRLCGDFVVVEDTLSQILNMAFQ